MVTSDPIADMLTRIRNAHAAGRDTVEMMHSRMKGEIARVLKREGYIRDYVTEGGAHKTLRVYLKYDAQRRPAVRGIRRMSSPGHRRYVGVDQLPRVLNGMGIAVLSTSGGLMTDKEARKRKTGGEVICTVW
jgi:small subunit ribosomal protein S8